MKKIEKFTGRYSSQKTLRFRLIPQGKTAEYFDANILEEDDQRSEDAKLVKKVIDRYHKDFIENALREFRLKNLSEYAEIYYSGSHDPKKSEDVAAKMRKEISKCFTDNPNYAKIFKKELMKEVLPEFLKEENEDLLLVEKFDNFFSFFDDYNKNRKNMYTGDGKSTEIAYRIVDQNLPKFLDNVKTGELIRTYLPTEYIAAVESDFAKVFSFDIKDIFTVEFFNHVLTQGGIDEYNQILGGYTDESGNHVKGYNNYINEYNQISERKIPKLKPLYKQILSERETLSFLPEKFNSSDELLTAVRRFYTVNDAQTEESIDTVIARICDLISSVSERDLSGIYITAGASVTELSNAVFGHWGVIENGLKEKYEREFPQKNQQSREKYEDDRDNYIKKIKSYSLADLQEAGELAAAEDKKGSLTEYIAGQSKVLADDISKTYTEARALLENPYPENKKLFRQDKDIALIKAFLDALKAFQRFAKMFCGSGDENGKDPYFYGEFITRFEQLDSLTPLYNKVRDYVTQKPYSTEKFRLTFGNPQILDGWHANKEIDYTSFILRKEEKYFLAIMNPKARVLFRNIPAPENKADEIMKMQYYQVANPAKDVPNLMVIDGKTQRKTGRKINGVNALLEEYKNTYLPEEVNRIRKKKSYLTSGDCFSKDDLATYIHYYKERVIEYLDYLDFDFKDDYEYDSFKDFTEDINRQAYQIRFKPISESFITDMVNEGNLFLFQIYNKDFSEHSKGIPNLHTMYFRMLFNPLNQKECVYKLSGGAQMFYRKKSLNREDTAIHYANQPIPRKEKGKENENSYFPYDIIKNRRFTERQFMLHMPIMLNFTSPDKDYINLDVREAIRECDDNYVIGIDRGERNLIYISVVNEKGEIKEQYSLNEIIDDKGRKTDYHYLLDKKEVERKAARQNWTAIENIKELKEGYISQVVHKICELVDKYDAVIAMEDLNFGFKNSRAKVEKQVYQKFEKMLIDKLNYYVDKKREPDSPGGLLHAYQLTEKFDSFKKMGKQNGFIFYVPAWLTSKIDPVTGFVDLLKPHYKSVADALAFFERFDRITYNPEKDYFEFDIDYEKFPGGVTDYRKKWTLTTQGERIQRVFTQGKSFKPVSRTVNLTEEFKNHFRSFGIDYEAADLKSEILKQDKKEYFVDLMRHVSLMLQMRNSSSESGEDYLISPVADKNGTFFDSRNGVDVLPVDADANGAYNIARKALWIIDEIKNCDESKISKVDMSISNRKWLKYAQKAND